MQYPPEPAQPQAPAPERSEPRLAIDERLNVLGERVHIDRDDLERMADGYRIGTRWTRSRTPRIRGSLLIGTSFFMIAFAFGALAAGRASEAGGFVLIAGIFFILYLQLPEAQHHARVMIPWLRFRHRMDELTSPIAIGVDKARITRRERGLLVAMQRERKRRITTLGEHFYRAVRTGETSPQISEAADKVRRIELQMLDQERRIDAIENGQSVDGRPMQA